MHHRWQELVQAEEVKRFWDRAESGGLAKKPVVSTRPPSKTKKT
jgi:hypothetical protein